MLVFNFGVFFEDNIKIKYMLVLDINFDTYKKNMIIVFFVGIRLHFLNFFSKFLKENRNLHQLVFNFGVFLGKHEN